MELWEEVGRRAQFETVSTFVRAKPLVVSTKDHSISTFVSPTSGQKPGLRWIKQIFMTGSHLLVVATRLAVVYNDYITCKPAPNIIWLLKDINTYNFGVDRVENPSKAAHIFLQISTKCLLSTLIGIHVIHLNSISVLILAPTHDGRLESYIIFIRNVTSNQWVTFLICSNLSSGRRRAIIIKQHKLNVLRPLQGLSSNKKQREGEKKKINLHLLLYV